MDRLMEEEQAQEEADTKVMLMKNRLEALRKKREAAKVSKASSKAASR
jgi:zinc finger protein 830